MTNEKVSKHSFQMVGQASSRKSNIILLGLIILNVIVYIIMIFFNAASATGFASKTFGISFDYK